MGRECKINIKMNIKHLYALVSVAALLALSGCGDGPSASDIDKTVRAKVDADTKQHNQSPWSMFDIQTEVHSVQKIGCVAASDSIGFNCDVEMDVSNSRTGRNKSVQKIRFVKGNDGWQVAQ